MSGLIPVKHAEIYWNQTLDGTPTEDVYVCDIRRRVDQNSGIHVGQYRFKLGAVCQSWMNGQDRTDTPEGIFVSTWLTAPERPTLSALKKALKEFAKIDRCTWATTMLAAIEHDPEYGIQGDAE